MVPCITVFLLSGKVTALKRQKRNSKRINVYLDGEYVLALPELEAARLKIGQWLDDSEIAALNETDERAARPSAGAQLSLLSTPKFG